MPNIPEFLKAVLAEMKLSAKLNWKGTQDSTVININVQNFNFLPFDPEVKQVASKLFDSADFGFGKRTLAPIQSRMASPKEKHRAIIQSLKPYMHPRDLNALVFAASIILMEDEGRDARRMTERLVATYGARGKKIYNLLRSTIPEGRTIFEDVICPFVDAAKVEYREDEAKIIGTFQVFFENLLNYYPGGIWLTEDTVFKRAVDDVKARLAKMSGSPVCIYSRGTERIEIAEKIREELIRDDPSLESRRIDYTLGLISACMIILWKKRH